MQNLESIIELENTKNYISAFTEYKKAFSFSQDFELWKHYYFFLWYISVEDFPLGLQDFVFENNIESELKEVGLFGIKNFSDNPEALFILGYTISLFPYYFGDYEKLEYEAKLMLKKANKIEPENLIYKLAFLGSNVKNKKLYERVCEEAAPKVIEVFNGKGLLNMYFKEVLYRKKSN